MERSPRHDRGNRLYLHRGDGHLHLGNGLVELGFDGQTGALVSLVDQATDCELLRHRDAPRRLFRLTLLDCSQREMAHLDANEATRLTWRRIRSRNGLSLRLHLDGFAKSAAAVTVTITLRAGSPLSTWRLRVTGLEAGYSVHQLTCPVVSGLMRAGDAAPGECLVTPMHGEGFLFRDPYPVVDRLPLKAGAGPESPAVGLGSFSGAYPGAMALQVLLYYHAVAGLYLATHDAGQHVKQFDVAAPGPEAPYPVVSVTHAATEHPGADATWDYDTVLGVFHGDWYDGADLYRTWARQQWWCAKRLSQRDLAPWLRQGFGVFQMSNYHIPVLDLNHSLAEIAETVNGLSAQAGVPLASLIFNFEAGGGWSGPMGLLPPREGEDAFRAAMARLRRAGNHGFVYIPGGTWYVALKAYKPPFDSWPQFEREGRANAPRNAKGEVEISRWYEGWEVARVCPGTEYFQQLTAEMALGCFELGCDVVQIDNFPCGNVAEPCYDPTHGHPLGSGPWRAQAWSRLLADLRQRAKTLNPDAALSTEGIAEGFIPWLDLYDQRAGNMEYFGHWGPGLPMGAETIPLFGYVYSGYIGAYLAAYPECSRPEVLYWTRCLGKALTQGVVPTGGKYLPQPRGLNPATIGFFHTVVRAAQSCWKYLFFGEMLRPPAIRVPMITASYVKFMLKGDRHEADPTQRHVVTDAAVQHSAWRAEDGSLAWIFANVAERPVRFAVELGPPDATKALWDITAKTAGRSRVMRRHVCLPQRTRLSMKPLSVTVIEAARRGSGQRPERRHGP